jgi:hypothetical protein
VSKRAGRRHSTTRRHGDTRSAEPLYTRYGFVPIERLTDDCGGVAVPLVKMAKPIE